MFSTSTINIIDITGKYILGTGIWFAIIIFIIELVRRHKINRMMKESLKVELSTNHYYFTCAKTLAKRKKQYPAILPKMDILNLIIQPEYLSKFNDKQAGCLLRLHNAMSAIQVSLKAKGPEKIKERKYLGSIDSVLEKLKECENLKMIIFKKEYNTDDFEKYWDQLIE